MISTLFFKDIQKLQESLLERSSVSFKFFSSSSLNKLEQKFKTVYFKRLEDLKHQVPYSVVSQQICLIAIIEKNSDTVIEAHNVCVKLSDSLIIYMNDSRIHNKIDTSAVSLYINKERSVYFDSDDKCNTRSLKYRDSQVMSESLKIKVLEGVVTLTMYQIVIMNSTCQIYKEFNSFYILIS